jgi:zinc D-Ala-D-Ala carboxypeptidase
MVAPVQALQTRLSAVRLADTHPPIDLRPRRPQVRRWGIAAVAIGTMLASVGAAQSEVKTAPTASVMAILAAIDTRQPTPSWNQHLVPEPRIGYLRGRRQTIQVVRIGEHELEVTTARAFLAMSEAAAASGVELQLSSGFRSREEQAELYRAWKQKRGHRAARPGRSNHQSGRAVDLIVLNDPAAGAWLEANAARFGFVRTVKDEPWHWEHVKAPRAVAAGKKRGGKKRGGKKPRPAAVARR